MKNQRKPCYVRMLIFSYWNAYLDHKALLVWILNYARLHQPNYKLYGYKSIFFLVKNLNATLFSHKLTSFEWLASIQYSTCKRHGPQPIPRIFCYFIASPSTVSRRTSKVKPIASLWSVHNTWITRLSHKTAVQYPIRTTYRIEHSPRNLPSMFCPSPILGKPIHLAPHIRETRQFR